MSSAHINSRKGDSLGQAALYIELRNIRSQTSSLKQVDFKISADTGNRCTWGYNRYSFYSCPSITAAGCPGLRFSSMLASPFCLILLCTELGLGATYVQHTKASSSMQDLGSKTMNTCIAVNPGPLK